MLGPLDYVLWFLSPAAEIIGLVCLIARRQVFRYAWISTYLATSAIVCLSEYLIIRHYGFSSHQYFYFYYYSESLFTILLYFVIMQFYQELFVEMKVSAYVRRIGIAVLALTAGFSYLVVHANRSHLTTHFVVELGQNLYFLGVVLTYLLWFSILKLHETRTRLVQLVLGLGVYFSAIAATYALRNLFPRLEGPFLHWLPPLTNDWLPIAWAFTFYKVPEEARLVTGRLLARAR
jgi:hypothetical protein